MVLSTNQLVQQCYNVVIALASLHKELVLDVKDRVPLFLCKPLLCYDYILVRVLNPSTSVM